MDSGSSKRLRVRGRGCQRRPDTVRPGREPSSPGGNSSAEPLCYGPRFPALRNKPPGHRHEPPGPWNERPGLRDAQQNPAPILRGERFPQEKPLLRETMWRGWMPAGCSCRVRSPAARPAGASPPRAGAPGLPGRSAAPARSWSTRVRSRCALRPAVASCRWSSPPTGPKSPSRASPRGPRVRVNGVRSSCETLAKSWDLRRPSSRSFSACAAIVAVRSSTRTSSRRCCARCRAAQSRVRPPRPQPPPGGSGRGTSGSPRTAGRSPAAPSRGARSTRRQDRRRGPGTCTSREVVPGGGIPQQPALPSGRSDFDGEIESQECARIL